MDATAQTTTTTTTDTDNESNNSNNNNDGRTNHDTPDMPTSTPQTSLEKGTTNAPKLKPAPPMLFHKLQKGDKRPKSKKPNSGQLKDLHTHHTTLAYNNKKIKWENAAAKDRESKTILHKGKQTTCMAVRKHLPHDNRPRIARCRICKPDRHSSIAKCRKEKMHTAPDWNKDDDYLDNTKWEKIPRAHRKKNPCQGQDTRLIRDASNREIQAVARVLDTRAKHAPFETPKLQKHRCTCTHLENQKEKRKNCSCGKQSGGVYALVCKKKAHKRTNTGGKVKKTRSGLAENKMYIGQSVDVLQRFHDHITKAFGSYTRDGKFDSDLDEMVFHMGPNSYKDWCIVLLEDVPKLDSTTEEWKQRRVEAEKQWIHRFNSAKPRGFNNPSAIGSFFKAKFFNNKQTPSESRIQPRKKRDRDNEDNNKDEDKDDEQQRTNRHCDEESRSIGDRMNDMHQFACSTNTGDDPTAGIPQHNMHVDEQTLEDMEDNRKCEHHLHLEKARRAWTELGQQISYDAVYNMLQAVHKHVRSGTLNAEMLKNWSTAALYRTLQFMASGAYFEWSNLQEAIAKLMLQQQIRRRRKDDKSKEKATGSVIITPFTGIASEAMNLQDIFSQQTAQSAFPTVVRTAMGYPKLRWSYEMSVGRLLINDKQHLKAFKFGDKSKDPQCLCNTTHWRKFKCKDGHVATTDLSCILDDDLRRMYEKGTTFKGTPDSGDYNSIGDDIQNIRSALTTYITQTCAWLGTSELEFAEWKSNVMTQVEERRHAISRTGLDGKYLYINWNQLQGKARKFGKHWTTCMSDKSSNTYTIKCRACLIEQAREEMVSTPNYEPSKAPRDELLRKHAAFVVNRFGMATGKAPTAKEAKEVKEADDKAKGAKRARGQQPATETTKKRKAKDRQSPRAFNFRFPGFGNLVKNHKEQKNRWLARSANTSLTQLSKWVHVGLKATMRTSEAMWRDMFHFHHINVAGSWIINNHRRVTENLVKMDSQGMRPHQDEMETFDFASMYTTMDHEVIKELLDEYVDMVFTQEATNNPSHKVLHLHKTGKPEWTPRKPATKTGKNNSTYTNQHITGKDFKEWIHFLLDNLYVEVGGELFQQTIGIPMGTNSAPMIANIVCFMQEFRYMRMLASNVEHVGDPQWVLLRQLSLNTRFIDDLLNLCVPGNVMRGIVLEIYSSSGLIITSEGAGNRVDYLDMTIWHSKRCNKMMSKVYDKRIALQAKGLQCNKFPHKDSCLSRQCKYGIVTSQCSRFLEAAPEPKQFAKAAVLLYKTFREKGYKMHLVDRYFCKFLRKHRARLHFKPTAIKTMVQHEDTLARFRNTKNTATCPDSPSHLPHPPPCPPPMPAQTPMQTPMPTQTPTQTPMPMPAPTATPTETPAPASTNGPTTAAQTRKRKTASSYFSNKADKTHRIEIQTTNTDVEMNNIPSTPIVGRRKMGKLTYFQLQLSDCRTRWQQEPPETSMREFADAKEYYIVWPDGMKSWEPMTNVPKLPCPGIIAPKPKLITWEMRQRIASQKARANQQKENKKIARLHVARRRRAEAWPAPTPSTPRHTLRDPEKVQDEYDDYIIQNAPRRIQTAQQVRFEDWDCQGKQAHLRQQQQQNNTTEPHFYTEEEHQAPILRFQNHDTALSSLALENRFQWRC
jgi:hypothetical protein